MVELASNSPLVGLATLPMPSSGNIEGIKICPPEAAQAVIGDSCGDNNDQWLTTIAERSSYLLFTTYTTDSGNSFLNNGVLAIDSTP